MPGAFGGLQRPVIVQRREETKAELQARLLTSNTTCIAETTPLTTLCKETPTKQTMVLWAFDNTRNKRT